MTNLFKSIKYCLLTILLISCNSEKDYEYTIKTFFANEEKINLIYEFFENNPIIEMITRFPKERVLLDKLLNIATGNEYGDFIIYLKGHKRSFFKYEDIDNAALSEKFNSFCTLHNLNPKELVRIIKLMGEVKISEVNNIGRMKIFLNYTYNYGLIRIEEKRIVDKDRIHIKGKWYFHVGN